MDPLFIALVIGILLSYFYAFIGGFTDAANAIATAIGSRALSARTAILMAGTLEIVGALTGTAVALTIGAGIVALELISLNTVIAALCAAMLWSLITYYFGLPVSETHGLVGGIIGAALAVAGLEVIIWNGVTLVLIAIIVSPFLGFLGGMLFTGIIYRLFWNAPAHKMNRIFKNLSRLSAAFMAFSHGRNDAQKPMGVLVMVLAIYFGWQNPSVPTWVILSIGTVAGLGVAYGGWRIIKTMGMKIAPISIEQSFSAQTSAALVMHGASIFGIPVSTTHTITSSIVGAGAAKRVSSLRLGIISEIAMSWILTLPATIILGWVLANLLGIIF
ncbi:MAG: inorganic phosphate transporter [Candidatus Diapherotrites archaeon]|nr:inorganic phosphate transporter [Candidatus Diapherotrites archaeon]